MPSTRATDRESPRRRRRLPTLAWLRRGPDRLPWLRFTLDVNSRFNELHGGYLAGAVTLAGFLLLFPLVLAATAILGFVAGDRPDLSHDIINRLGIPLNGEEADTIRQGVNTAQDAKLTASAFGIAGLLWSGLGVVAALQYAYDSVWQVTGRGMKDKAFGLMWLFGSALMFVGSFAITTAIQFLPAWLAPLNVGAALAVSVAMFLWAGKVLVNIEVGWAALVPGAVVTAVGFEILKVIGAIYLPNVIASSSAVYGSFGAVFAILAWLLFFGRLLVYGQVVNVIAWERSRGTAHLEPSFQPSSVGIGGVGIVHDDPADPMS